MHRRRSLQNALMRLIHNNVGLLLWDLLLRMLRSCEQSSPLGAILQTAFYLVLIGFLPILELTYSAPDREDPDFAKSFLALRSVAFRAKNALDFTLLAS